MNKLKVVIFIVVSVVYIFCASGHPWVEGDIQLTVARQLWAHARVSFDTQVAYTMLPGVNGRFYDVHQFAHVVMLVPFAALESVIAPFAKTQTGMMVSFLAALSGALVSATAAIIFFSILQTLRLTRAASFYACLCMSFLTIVFPYAVTNYEGNLNMALLLVSVYCLLQFMGRFDSIGWLAAASCAASWALNTRDSSVIFLILLSIAVIVLSVRLHRPVLVAVSFAAVLPGIVWWGYYNWLRTGFFYLSPQIYEMMFTDTHIRLSGNILQGLYVLLLSPGGSIFIYSPILVVSFLGWRQFYRANKQLALFIAIVVVGFLLANARLEDRMGLWGWGPRYTLEITPLLMIPLAYWFNGGGMRKISARCFFFIIASASFLMQCAGTFTNWHARLGYLIDRFGADGLWGAVGRSQWLDAFRVLAANSLHLIADVPPLLVGYDPTLSPESVYISTTVFTWWNRLLYLGVHPWIIGLYCILTAVMVTEGVVIVAREIGKGTAP